MIRLQRAYGRLSALGAAECAAIITAGLLAAPATIGSPNHGYAPVISVQSHAVALTATTFGSPDSEMTPHAAVALPTPVEITNGVAIVVATTVVAAGWFAASPITLPGSFAAAAVFNVLARGVSMQTITIDPAFVLTVGLGIYLGAPILIGTVAATAVVQTLTSVLGKANSTPAAAKFARSTSTSRDHGSSAVAGSRRAAKPDRKPSTHRTTKATSASHTTKHPGTAGSGRGISKGTPR